MNPLGILLERLTQPNAPASAGIVAWPAARDEALSTACDESDWRTVLDSTRP